MTGSWRRSCRKAVRPSLDRHGVGAVVAAAATVAEKDKEHRKDAGESRSADGGCESLLL